MSQLINSNWLIVAIVNTGINQFHEENFLHFSRSQCCRGSCIKRFGIRCSTQTRRWWKIVSLQWFAQCWRKSQEIQQRNVFQKCTKSSYHRFSWRRQQIQTIFTLFAKGRKDASSCWICGFRFKVSCLHPERNLCGDFPLSW